jgi:hypothetical protein
MSRSSPQRPSVRVPSTKAAGTPDEVARLDGLGLDEVAAWFALRRHVELTLYGAVTMLAAVFALTAEAVVNTTAGLVAVMWASGIGLMVAHWFAAAVSGRVMSPEPVPIGRFLRELWDTYPLVFSAVVGTIGAVLGTLGEAGGIDRAVRGADIAIVSLCAFVAWRGGAAHGLSLARKLLITTGVVLFAALVAGVKTVL